MIAPTSAISNLTVRGNTITDNLSTTRMVYGISSYVSLSSPFTGNTINVTGVTTTAFLNAHYFSFNTQLPLIQDVVNVPVGTDTPAATVADGSFINSIQAAQWYWVNPTGTIWNDPSVLFTTDQLYHCTAQSLDIVSGYGTLENQFEYSEALTTSPWDTVGGTTTANAANNPFGGSNANLLTEDTSTGGHYVYQFVTLAGGVYEFSVYEKSNGDGILIQPLSGGPYAGFNLSTGTVCTQGAGGVGSIQAIGGGWYRVSLLTASLASGSQEFSIFTTNGSCTNNYTGNGTSGAYLWGIVTEILHRRYSLI